MYFSMFSPIWFHGRPAGINIFIGFASCLDENQVVQEPDLHSSAVEVVLERAATFPTSILLFSRLSQRGALITGEKITEPFLGISNIR